MDKYCCFFCPSKDYAEKKLEDKCPTCDREYGLPLFQPPNEIGDYKVVRSLRRGFYATTYIVERKGPLKAKFVLKVSPKSFYDFFSEKDFERECQKHHKVAEGTEHIVKISDVRDEVITFGKEDLDCHVAELEYVNGPLLADYLTGKEQVTAQIAAQVAIDLLRLREELEKKGAYHNDLHAENVIVEQLSSGRQRANAIDHSIRTIAIDLGSVDDQSKSDDNRYGDLRQIGDHINGLIAGLLSDPDSVNDHEYRLACALQHIFHMLAARAESHRMPAAQELIEQIEEAYERLPRHPWRPWTNPFTLRSFGSYYNAQTLQSWNVPELLVDPEGTWLSQISTPGPQVVTGMRGCGKTMLLRALQFHARASKTSSMESETSVLKRIQDDSFVGLFVSAQRLLDTPGGGQNKDVDPFSRLFVAYVIEALRALMHLKDIDQSQVVDVAHKIIASVVVRLMGDAENIADAIDSDELDFRLNNLLIKMSRGEISQTLSGHPNDAFIHLAEAVKKCSQSWANAQILFLLDDVSTRYLKEQRIEELLSALLFQSPVCAFKVTSEVQTMELGLTTPGENLRARVGRDLAVFDLGSEVYNRIKGKSGKKFVTKILAQRAQYFPAHPPFGPAEILGDVNLETIAKEIASSSNTSGKRKKVYHGITALAHVCVGDIGDVISLYERILKEAKGKYPVAPKNQSECFQNHCSNSLYDLNRRGGELKDAAKSFAQASYELMVKSYREGKKSGKEPLRIRQYASIYVRITAGDMVKQMGQLRDLIDAGVFVFTGGNPRVKTKDSDPIQQFKLTFRRIYGLTNYIGLAERDRFELSGPDLEAWLDSPANGKKILLQNLGGGISAEEDDQYEEEETAAKTDVGTVPTLFDTINNNHVDTCEAEINDNQIEEPIPSRISVQELPYGAINYQKIDTVILGLGFEERTLKSVEVMVKHLPPSKVLAIQYPEKGRAEEILNTLDEWGAEVEILAYEKFVESGLVTVHGSTLIDITGLSKPIIFQAVRTSLKEKRTVIISHTHAEQHYPLESELGALLEAQENQDREKFFDALSKLMTGELGPYECDRLLSSDSDDTRRRVLFAFSSPKHERLLSLLDQRDFDRLEIVAPARDTARTHVARQVADIAALDNSSSGVTQIESDDLSGTIDFLSKGFSDWYVKMGMNLEIGLTGSKIQAVAAAAITATSKVTQCWYLRPQKFDPERFTKGVGDTHLFRISVNSSKLET